MSKAILSLFCVAALYSSGLVFAMPGNTGEAVEKGIQKAGNLLDTGLDEAGKALGIEANSTGGQIFDIIKTGVGAAIDFGADAAGKAVNGASNVKDLASSGIKLATSAANNKANELNNSGNRQQQNQQQIAQAKFGGNQGNGGNTIQIPTIFFLILAIFNH